MLSKFGQAMLGRLQSTASLRGINVPLRSAACFPVGLGCFFERGEDGHRIRRGDSFLLFHCEIIAATQVDRRLRTDRVFRWSTPARTCAPLLSLVNHRTTISPTR